MRIATCDFELLSTCTAYVTGLGDKDLRRVRNAEKLFARYRARCVPFFLAPRFSRPPTLPYLPGRLAGNGIRKARNLHKSLKRGRFDVSVSFSASRGDAVLILFFSLSLSTSLSFFLHFFCRVLSVRGVRKRDGRRRTTPQTRISAIDAIDVSAKNQRDDSKKTKNRFDGYCPAA